MGPALAARHRTWPWSATTTSPSTRGAAPTCATSSTSSATTPNATVVKLEQNYRSTQLILDAAHAVVSRNNDAQGQEAVDGEPGGRPIERFEADYEDEEAEWIARQVEALAGGLALDPGPAGGRGRRAAEPARHRDHVPHQRPEPGDRGGVPALRPALPAGRRHALLPAPRGQGRAGLPARPAQRHGRVAFERIINVPARGIGEKTIEALRAAAAARGAATSGRRSGRRPRPDRRRSRRGRASALAGFVGLVRALRARIGVLRCRSCSTRSRGVGLSGDAARRLAGGRGSLGNLLELREVDPLRRPDPRTRSTGCSRRRPSSPTRTPTRGTPTRSR